MSWIEITAIAVLLIGLGAGGFLVAQRPSFWLGMAGEVIQLLLPVLAKRMPPEKEREMQECIRRGGQWDNFRKRCKR